MDSKLIIIISAIILVVLLVIVIYNSLLRLRVGVEEAFATMDVYLKKRFDYIPNLVNIVKGYAKHEKELLNDITKARASIAGARSDSERLSAEANMNGFLGRLIAVAENYPDLKANQNFIDLSAKLAEVEDGIQKSRLYYNAQVKQNNFKVQSFPLNIIAGIFGFKTYPYFEIENNERQNVEISF